MGSILDHHEERTDYLVYLAGDSVRIEKSYSTTTKRETLGRVFNVTKLWLYLLGRLFHFYVDHQNLLYHINKVVI